MVFDPGPRSDSFKRSKEVETMWILWPVPIFLGVAVVFIVVLAFGRRLFPGTYTSRRAFWCPFRGRNVRVDFRKSIWDASPLEVDACSAFSPPVQCEKACLLLGKFPVIKEEIAPSAH